MTKKGGMVEGCLTILIKFYLVTGSQITAPSNVKKKSQKNYFSWQEMWGTSCNIFCTILNLFEKIKHTLCNNKMEVENNTFTLHGWSTDQLDTGLKRTNTGPRPFVIVWEFCSINQSKVIRKRWEERKGRRKTDKWIHPEAKRY